jgi:16S rRNA processing protein RimM
MLHAFPTYYAPDTGSASAESASADSDETAPVDADDAPLIQVGFVFRPHGVGGELKIKPETSDPTQFEVFERVWIGPKAESSSAYDIASVRYQQTKRGTTVILQLDGVDSRDDAELITKQSVFVPEDELLIDEEELLLHDLIDLEVVTTAGDAFGVVTDVVEHPAHLTLMIRRHDGPEAMIPFVDDFVAGVDLGAGCLTVELIDGLVE